MPKPDKAIPGLLDKFRKAAFRMKRPCVIENSDGSVTIYDDVPCAAKGRCVLCGVVISEVTNGNMIKNGRIVTTACNRCIEKREANVKGKRKAKKKKA